MQAVILALLGLAAPWQADAVSPIEKVISMLSNLQAKVIKDGEVAQQEYTQFARWCEDRSMDLGNEIKTGSAEAESLKAAIANEVASTGSLDAKVQELAAALATDEADRKAATEIRAKEAADFAAENQEMTLTISMLRRATQILEREMKGGASMLQLKSASSVTQALAVMLRASLIGSSDAARLSALVQESQEGQDVDSDEELGAPAAAVYGSHSKGIVETLQDLTEKAESQLEEARKKETTSLHNFEMLKQSLDDEIKFATEDMAEAKKGLAVSAEKKAGAEGDLEVTSKELAADVSSKAALHQDCMTKAETFEAETKSRNEELKALATAKKVIVEATGGAAFSQVSFLQVARSRLSSGMDLANFEAVRLVRDLARKEHSSALAQLASRMASAMRSGGGEDPFQKVKGLISEMLAKLEAEAGADATKKAYCDKELAETTAKKLDKSNEIDKLSTRIERMDTTSAQLKEEVATLQAELAKLAKSQAEMDALRQEEKATYGANKAELEQGLDGIKLALQILTEYYGRTDKAHLAAEGDASGIVGLLEVIEADMSKNLAEINAEEEASAAEYEKMTKLGEVERTGKEQDAKYKTKESKDLDKSSAELKSDRSGVQAELDAVLEYLSKMEDECKETAEAYEVRKARRESELAGLKEALTILENETALLQRSSAAHRSLRGAARRHAVALRAAA